MFDRCSLFLMIAYCVRSLLIVFDYFLLFLILFDLLLVCVWFTFQMRKQNNCI